MANEAIGISSKIVTVFGGSGFLGRHVVQALGAARLPRAPCRAPARSRGLSAAARHGRPGHAGAGQSALPLVGREGGGRRRAPSSTSSASSRRRAARPSRRCRTRARGWWPKVAAAERARLVQVSAIGADPQGADALSAHQGRGRKRRRSRSPGAVVLRPSVIFGPEDDFFNRFAALARLLPVMPLIGDGADEVPAGLRRRCRRDDRARRRRHDRGRQDLRARRADRS